MRIIDKGKSYITVDHGKGCVVSFYGKGSSKNRWGEKDIAYIRRHYGNGMNLYDLAEYFGVTVGAVAMCICRHRLRIRNIWDDEARVEVQEARLRGESVKSIAKRYGVGVGIIYRVLKRV